MPVNQSCKPAFSTAQRFNCTRLVGSKNASARMSKLNARHRAIAGSPKQRWVAWGRDKEPGLTSGTPPGSMRREAFHFLAAPAPQCISNWVQLNMRLASGLSPQSEHRHTMRCRPSRKMPRIPLQNTGICNHDNNDGFQERLITAIFIKYSIERKRLSSSHAQPALNLEHLEAAMSTWCGKDIQVPYGAMT